MMLTIYGLPMSLKYQDIKAIIRQQCNIFDFILDDLVIKGNVKNIRVGLANDNDGAHVMKCLDGFRVSGNMLQVIPVGKTVPSGPNQTYNGESFTRNEMQNQQNYGQTLQRDPWAGQIRPSWNAQPQAVTQHNIYQQLRPVQSQPYMQQQPRGPHMNVHAENIPPAGRPMPVGRFAGPNNYEVRPDKPITIMRDNFQGPTHYNVQNQEPGHFHSQPTPVAWTPQTQQRPQFAQGPEKVPYDNRNLRECNVRPGPVELPNEFKGAKKLPSRISPNLGAPQYGISSGGRSLLNSQRPQERKNISPARRMSPVRRLSPERRLSPGRRISPNRRMLSGGRMSPGRKISPPSGKMALASGRRISPSNRYMPPDRQVSPGREMSTLGRRMSSHGRGISPGRKMSPSSRRISPSRRVSPERKTGQRDKSPSDRRRELLYGNRGMSPPGRHNSPPRRRISPPHHLSGRFIPTTGRISPSRRLSPHRRDDMRETEVYTGREMAVDDGRPTSARHRSPFRRGSPGRHIRYSPSYETSLEKFDRSSDTRPGFKYVRPAYEHDKGLNQATHSSSFRLNIREDKSYSRNSPERDTRWQKRDKQFSQKNFNDDRKDLSELQTRFSDRQPSFSEQHMQKSRSHMHEVQKERSPNRDRLKRHSPSSPLPRQSWENTFDKRRSPDIQEAPPPPVWPGQRDSTNYKQDRQRYSGSSQNNQIGHWERKVDELRGKISLQENIKKSTTDGNWKPLLSHFSPKRSAQPFLDNNRFQESRDNRKHLEKKNEDTYPRGIKHSRESFRDGIEEYTKETDSHHSGKYKRTEFMKKQEELSKEIDDVCKRAGDFTKKAEMFRKGEYRSDSKYNEDGHYSNVSDQKKNKDRFKHQSLQEGVSKRPNLNEEPIKDKDEGINSKYKLNDSTKIKRNKAVSEISEKMMSKYGRNLGDEIQYLVQKEVKLIISRILFNMFGNEDVSFIESVIKFDSRHTSKDQLVIFKKAVATVSSRYSKLKRASMEEIDVPAKISKSSPVAKFSEDWNIGLFQPNLASTILPNTAFFPIATVPPLGVPVTPAVVVPTLNEYQYIQPYQEFNTAIGQESVETSQHKDKFSIYLCKDDFTPFLEFEEDALKKFIVGEMLKVTAKSQGWAPDFTLSKQDNAFRREIVTRDEKSMDWLMCLDFTDFKLFNVLIHTAEQLWYVRAAIWLPGHSRCRNIEPLTKLKLQNKHLEGVNIGKWKFVKKIITQNGVRLYVDMPPTSSRALEKCKKMLSFELQKVNVFLKADAVDKDTFDSGLYDKSITSVPLSQNTPMPSLGNKSEAVMMSFPDNKPLTVPMAHKIKDDIIYKLFIYLQNGGTSRTDFVKYGLCQRKQFGVVPENEESRRWLCSLELSKIKQRPVVVVGADVERRYLKMFVELPNDYYRNAAVVMEGLVRCNKGVKGINFNLWKNPIIKTFSGNLEKKLEVDMDIDSIEAISSINYKLDYIKTGHIATSVIVRSTYSYSKLEEEISKLKAELNDTYVVSNMQISSDSEDGYDTILLD